MSKPTLRDVTAATHLPALDGLRAVAIGGVMVFHYGLLPFGFAKLGVSLFFVLSGFLITLLMLREHEATGTVSLKRFYARRALRIFPAYYVFLAVAFGWMAFHGDAVPGALVLVSVFYVLNYAQASGSFRQTPVSHCWSLAIEEQFYLLWPFMLRTAWRRQMPVRALIAGVIVAICIWRTILAAADVGRGYYYFAFDTRFDTLLIGCALAVCARDEWTQRAARVVSFGPLAPLVTLGLLVLAQIMPYDLFRLTLGNSVEALLLAVLLVQGLMLHQHALWRWLNWPVVRYLGTISYPLYLYHQLSGPIVDSLGQPRWAVHLMLQVVLAVALAVTSYHVVEQPFLRLKLRLAARTSRPMAPVLSEAAAEA